MPESWKRHGHRIDFGIFAAAAVHPPVLQLDYQKCSRSGQVISVATTNFIVSKNLSAT